MGWRARLLLAGGLGLGLLMTGSARGQTLVRVSPLLQVTAGYSDNFTLSPNHHLDDLVTTSVAGFTLDFGGGGRRGSLQYDTVLQDFAAHPDFNRYASTNFVTLADLETLSPELALLVNDSIVTGDAPGGLLVGNTGAVSTQVAQAAVANSPTTSNNFSLGLDRQIGPRWIATATVFQDFYITGLQSSFTQGGGVSVLYALTPRLAAGAGYWLTDFLFSSLPSAEAHLPALIVKWSPLERLTLDLAGGVAVLDNTGGSHASGSLLGRPAGRGTLSFDSGRWAVTLGGGQVPSSTGGLGGAGVSRYANGVITYALQRHTTAHVGASYAGYAGGGANGSFVSFGAGIATQPRRWLTLFAQYQGFRNTVDAVSSATPTAFTVRPGQTAAANTYIVGLRTAFDAWDFAL